MGTMNPKGASRVVDLVSSRAYPTLERSPGKNDNWVENMGGLPSYIERIAKHLHYEQGMTISRSIAVAVNTVKRWARGGTVTKNGVTTRITKVTQVKAAKAVAEWEAKKAKAHLNLSNAKCTYCDAPPTKAIKTPKGGVVTVCAKHVATAKVRISNTPGPVKKNVSRVNNLSNDQIARTIDLALTKDGRKSFKKQGRWGHGFVPLDAKAKEAKAKGSPIAMKRVNRIYATQANKLKASKVGGTERTSTGRAATSRRPYFTKSTIDQRLGHTSGGAKLEHSKGGASSARALKPWNEIAEKDKTIRNGTRYVMSIYKGKAQLVEWLGESGPTKTNLETERLYRTITETDAAKLTSGTIRKLLKNGKQPPSVEKVLNKVLKKKIAEAKTKIGKF